MDKLGSGRVGAIEPAVEAGNPGMTQGVIAVRWGMTMLSGGIAFAVDGESIAIPEDAIKDGDIAAENTIGTGFASQSTDVDAALRGICIAGRRQADQPNSSDCPLLLFMRGTL